MSVNQSPTAFRVDEEHSHGNPTPQILKPWLTEPQYGRDRRQEVTTQKEEVKRAAEAEGKKLPPSIKISTAIDGEEVFLVPSTTSYTEPGPLVKRLQTENQKFLIR